MLARQIPQMGGVCPVVQGLAIPRPFVRVADVVLRHVVRVGANRRSLDSRRSMQSTEISSLPDVALVQVYDHVLALLVQFLHSVVMIVSL